MSSHPPAIFHLSFPVHSLETSIAFYRDCLGASVGRTSAEWADIILFGHQLTLHNQPSQVLPRATRGVRHFGVILSWGQWEAVRSRVLACHSALEAEVRHLLPGEAGEHVKLHLEDPDGNLIELKAYKHIDPVSTRRRKS